jgi:hypothetical protein
VDLYVDIIQYSAVGEVILLGDFISCIRSLQIPLNNFLVDVFCIWDIDLE